MLPRPPMISILGYILWPIVSFWSCIIVKFWRILSLLDVNILCLVSRKNFSFFRNFSNFRTTDISRSDIVFARSNLIHHSKCLVTQKNFRNFRRQPNSHPVWFHLGTNNNSFILSKNFRNFRGPILSRGDNIILVTYSHECRCLCVR